MNSTDPLIIAAFIATFLLGPWIGSEDAERLFNRIFGRAYP